MQQTHIDQTSVNVSGRKRRFAKHKSCTRCLTLPTTALSLALLALAAVGQAQLPALSFTLNPVTQVGSPGGEVFFSGTLTNNTGSQLFLNSIQFNFDAPGSAFLTGDDGPFYSVVPASLAASGLTATYTGIVFGVRLAPNTPPISPVTLAYTGSAAIFGGANDTAVTPLNSQNFRVVTPAVPEPGSYALLAGTALAGIGLARHRRR